MKRKTFRLINSLAVLSLLLSSCTGVTAIPTTQPTQPPTQPTLTLDIQKEKTGPSIVAQKPMEGERLALEAALQIVFDRDMNQPKTADAFTLLDSNNKSVSGKINWLDARTFTFTPDSKLEPSSTYRAVFSTDATSADGVALQEEIQIDFPTADALAVSQVFPTIDAEAVDGTTSITVIFNRAVVPLQIKEEQSNLPQPLEISPATEGQGEWVSSSVYVFQPEKPLLSGTRYTVRVESGLKDTTGDALEKSYVWQFATRPPLIQNFGLKNGEQNPPETIENVLLDQAFEITFAQPMDAKSTEKAVALTDRETEKLFPIRTKWNKDFTLLTIEPAGRYKVASFYDLNIGASALAQDGGPLADGLDLKLSTVPLPRILNVTGAPNTPGKGYSGDMTIKFASPMNFASVKDRIRISPEPKQKPQIYYDEYNWQVNIYGFEPATDYVVRLLPGMTDLYGNAIATETSYSFKTGDLPSYAQLIAPWSGLVYRAKGPQETFFEYNNLNSATISLYPLTFDEFSDLANPNGSPTTFKPKTQPIREWQPDMRVARNQTQRFNFKLEDPKGNRLPPGYYMLGVQGAPLDYKTNFFQVSLFIVATDNITFKATASEGMAWVTDLESGAPQADVSVSFYDEKWNEVGTTKTDKNGLAYVKDIKSPVYVRAEGTNHLAYTSMDWGSGVSAGDFGLYETYYSATKIPFAYVYTDRPVYRPDQEVYFKGIVRQNDDLHYSLPKDKEIFVTIEHEGEQVYAESLSLSEMGSFDGTFKIAEDAALGSYDIFVRPTKTGDPFSSVTFRVAEYHKPEFEVTAQPDKANLLTGDTLHLGLDAAYYSGGAVGNAQVEWFMEANPYFFQPSSEYSQFNFIDWDRDVYWSPQPSGQSGVLAQGKGVTDASGHLDIAQTLGLKGSKVSQQVSFSANVTDVAGNLVSGGTSLVVHQSEVYAGIRATSYVGTAGKEQPFEVVVLDWDSKPVANQNVTVKFVERRWYSAQTQDKQGQLRWETSVRDIPVAQQNAVTGEDGKVTVSFVPPAGGEYKALVTVRDSKGHTHQSSAFVWVSSDEYIAWKQTNDRTFTLVADKDTYEPGDTAEILIAQPFEHDVYALVTYERGHVYKQEVMLLKGNSTIYKLPITGDMAPMAFVSVTVVSGAEQSGTPDFKIGMTRIGIDTRERKLDVAITTDKKSTGPGDTVTYTIETKDDKGKPVSADVSLAVVDKAALALAPSNTAPILDAFYPEQALSVRTALGIVLNAEDFNAQYRESISDGRGGGGGGGGDLGIITVRGNFKDTAFFKAETITDEEGKAQLTVTLPDNLTTWHADARAVSEDSRVGQGTQELVSTKRLFIQLQTPRFFVAGDEARVGAIIHNNEEQPLKVNVSLEAQGVDLKSQADQVIDVPAKQQAYATWDMNIKPGATRVDLTATAVSGALQDASKPALGTLSDQGIPVYNFTATETVGTSGILASADSSTEAFQLPTSYKYTDAQLSVEVAPSLAASMQNSLTYLEDYPYLCMEQTVSRFLPNVITSRALKAANLTPVTLQSDLDTQVKTALQRIYAKQNPDGGWNWWDGPQSDPYTSAYVVYGLIEAKESGYDISQGVLARGISYLSGNLPDLRRNDATWQYNRFAFMLYVLARAEELGAGQTNYIYEHRASLSLYGEAYLAQAMYLLDAKDERINSLLSDIESAAALSASGAHWDESISDYFNWNTGTRSTAIILNALTQIDPKNPITANAVRWLMAHREKGHWGTTQETTWSLIALTNWLTVSKEYETNYEYAIGLNGEKVKEGSADKDNLTQVVKLQVELKDMLKDSANYLVFTRGSGNGNLYYTSYLSTTLPIESIEPLDQGASISRQYFTLDDSKHPITEVKRGDLVRVRLTMVLPSSMHYFVVDDPLPAGLEAIDTTIATDTAVPTSYTIQDYDERGWGWWYFTHTELRDEKVVLSSDYLPAGTYVFTYLARASTAGTFNVIPPTGSEFYFPDVGGRGAGSEFVVKP